MTDDAAATVVRLGRGFKSPERRAELNVIYLAALFTADVGENILKLYPGARAEPMLLLEEPYFEEMKRLLRTWLDRSLTKGDLA